MPLHPYQTDAVKNVLEAFEKHRSVMLQMPTGAGKTHVFCEIAKGFYIEREGRVLVLAHRKELIQQIQNRLKKFGMNSGIIQSGHEEDENAQIQVASVQTLYRRNNSIHLNNVSLIIVDEAHHTRSATYLAILKAYQRSNTKLLGVTATPERLDGQGFENIFDHLISSPQISWFVEQGYLAPVRHYASDIIKLEGVSIKKYRKGYSDYDDEKAVRYYMGENIMADIIDSYERFGENKKAIVFAITIAHAKELSDRFNENGHVSKVVSSLTKAPEREIILKRFKNNDIKILVNVDIFSEGFDCPDIEVVQIARPTKSLVKYLQMVGRVTRTFEGKDYAIVLDNACLWQDHGLISNVREWTLNGSNLMQEVFDGLVFSDGAGGEAAYRHRMKEIPDINMVEVDSLGHKEEVIFTKRRLEAVMSEYHVTGPEVFDYLETLTSIDLKEHFKGKGSDFKKKFVSEHLLKLIDFKFSSHKALKA